MFSCTLPCAHKTIFQAFMPESRSQAVNSGVLFYGANSTTVNPDGCQGEILLSLYTLFTDLSPGTCAAAKTKDSKFVIAEQLIISILSEATCARARE